MCTLGEKQKRQQRGALGRNKAIRSIGYNYTAKQGTRQTHQEAKGQGGLSSCEISPAHPEAPRRWRAPYEDVQ